MKQRVEVVWFKRDLRVADHRPLVEASIRGPTLPLFIYEPSIHEAPDYGEFQRHFLVDSLSHLAQRLAAMGSPLWLEQGEAVEVLEKLRKRVGPFALWSHEETGNDRSYRRDRAVGQWCRQSGIVWTEFPQHGVVRRLTDRDRWSSRWEQRMQGEPLKAPPELRAPGAGCRDGAGAVLAVKAHGSRGDDLRGGEAEAWERLESFLRERGCGYRRRMSSPVEAYDACSRLSAHLALGTISMRSAVQRARAYLKTEAPVAKAGARAADVRSFLSRCHWHCHFMQKLESEPAIEFHAFNRACDQLREPGGVPGRLEAWLSGQTGYPFVDACLRSLQSRGWINFRMRSMLVSFAAYDLWLDWRDLAHPMARWFTDYEPGIHYSQLQMQSGVTGINTLRIYNPVKQGIDHDPAGIFIRRWVPELEGLPDECLHEPWKAGPATLVRAGVRLGKSYPLPVVDHAEAVRAARVAMGQLRRTDYFWEEARRVQEQHGSRASRENRHRPRRARTESGRQGELGLEGGA